MADIRAFRAFRYDMARVGSLSDVVAPPYDVIDAALQQKLYDASEFNAIRVELTKDGTGDKYATAAQTLRDWMGVEALRQDTARGLYVYEQEFTVEGVRHVRRGFMARVRVVPFGEGVFPHEQTLSGPKADRLNLYRATGFNISPVFSLYPDDGSVFAKLEPGIRQSPPLEATDHLGVIHRLWVVTDPQVITTVIGAMGDKPVFIADGHHRYETALKYKEEQQATDDEAPANFCLMMLVGMTDPGLLILPTHRLLSNVPANSSEELQHKLTEYFEIVEHSTSAQDCWESISIDGNQNVLGFGTVADNTWFVARLKDTAIMDELAPQQSPEWRGLGVSILHKLVLEKILGGKPKCQYVHLMKEVTDAVQAKSCAIACLVPPATMNDVELIAGNLEKMPPKSTYFYPKLLTGMVFNSLKKD